MQKKGKSGRSAAVEELLQLRAAALQLGVSFPTSSTGSTIRKFAASRRPADTTEFRKVKWTSCSSEPGTKR